MTGQTTIVYEGNDMMHRNAEFMASILILLWNKTCVK